MYYFYNIKGKFYNLEMQIFVLKSYIKYSTKIISFKTNFNTQILSFIKVNLFSYENYI